MHLKGCCCGCSLKTGTIIIGAYDLITSVPTFIRLSIGTLHLSDTEVNSVQMAGMSFADVIIGLNILFAIMLIYGANNERADLVKPWYIYTIVMTVLGAIICLGLIILFFHVFATATSIIILFLILLMFALRIYFILVTKSFHTELVSGMQFDNELGLQRKEEPIYITNGSANKIP